MAIYSHTILEAWAECMMMGKASMGTRVQKAGPSRQGQWAHALREAYVKHLVEGGLASDLLFGHDLIGSMIGQLPAADAKGIEEAARRWVDTYDASFLFGGRDHVFEKRRYVDLEGRPQVPSVSVTLPLYAWTSDHAWMDSDGVLNVLDVKSGQVIEHIAAPDLNRQLLRYAGAHARHEGYEGPVRLHVEHLRHCWREEELVEQEQIDQAWDDLVVAPVQACMRTDSREVYTVGPHCRDCDIRGLCSAYARFPQTWDPSSGATLGDLITAERILDQQHAEALELLKKLMPEDEERVVHMGFEARRGVSQKVGFDSLKLFPLLTAAGLSPEVISQEVFRATKTSVKDALTKAGVKKQVRAQLLEQWIEQAGQVRLESRFSVRRQHTPRPRRQKKADGDVLVDVADVTEDLAFLGED